MKKQYKKIPQDAKQIQNSKDYICPDGTVYSPVTNYKGRYSGYFYQKTPITNKQCGYVYVGIYDNTINKTKNRRLHRVVAETFIPNPNGLPVVGHKNNIKNDNRINNLYWTTWKENIQKAVNDDILINDKGIEDSQSKPVNMYETTTNELLGRFGSAREAARETGISLTTICRQAKYHRPVRKSYYFRYADDRSVVKNTIINGYRYVDDMYIGSYFSVADASRKTGINEKTISQQIQKNKKPNQNKKNTVFYFLKQSNQVNVNRLSKGDEPSRVAKAKE